MAEVRLWSPAPAGTSQYIERLPDATSSLTFRATARGVDLSVAGAVSRAVYKEPPGQLLAISVIFKPGGAYPFFGVPMHTLADRSVPLEELWGPQARALLARLLGCLDVAQAAERLEQALTARLEHEAHLELRSAVQVLQAVRRVVSGEHGIDVADLARRVGLSERQLRRVFATAVGIGPKQDLQMLRFNRAARLTGMSGGELASAAGYYDQAHLISEFQHLARMTPRAFANRRRAGVSALSQGCPRG